MSSGDEVLAINTQKPIGVITGWGFQLNPFALIDSRTLGALAWQKQELFKGRNVSVAHASRHMGWGFKDWFPSAQQAHQMTNNIAALQTNTIFRLPSRLRNAAADTHSLTQLEIDYHLVCDIPALAPNIGICANSIEITMPIYDFESSSFRDINTWPRDHKEYGKQWLHSDMVNMAYPYVIQFYINIVKNENFKGGN